MQKRGICLNSQLVLLEAMALKVISKCLHEAVDSEFSSVWSDYVNPHKPMRLGKLVRDFLSMVKVNQQTDLIRHKADSVA